MQMGSSKTIKNIAIEENHYYAPVCDINRITAGSARRKSKSCPLGLIDMLPRMALISGGRHLGVGAKVALNRFYLLDLAHK